MWLRKGIFGNAYLVGIPADLLGVVKAAFRQAFAWRVFGFCSRRVICFDLRRKIQESSVMLMERGFEDVCELR